MGIDVHQLIDDYYPTITLSAYRRLKSNVPTRTKPYVKSVNEAWDHHKIDLKISQIEKLLEALGPNPATLAHINNIDKQICAILTSAEINCCKVGRHCTSLFSTKLAKLVRQERRQVNTIRKTSMQQSIDTISDTISKLVLELRKTRQDLKLTKQNDIDFRKEHLKECAKLCVERRPETTVPGHIKRLEHPELQISRAKKIKKKR